VKVLKKFEMILKDLEEFEKEFEKEIEKEFSREKTFCD
jgi:hypothetical protein